MEYTEKFGLGMPDKGEFYDVEVQNDNMKIIEEELSNRPTSDGDVSDMTAEFTQASSTANITTGEKLSVSLGKIAKAIVDFINHLANIDNPHRVTASQVGADEEGSAQASYENSVAYTDKVVADLINGAPSTLDTLKEIADAMEENETVVDALNDAIGSKANATEFDSHVSNTNNPHGVTKAQVGLGNVDNTADADKCVKYATTSSSATYASMAQRMHSSGMYLAVGSSARPVYFSDGIPVACDYDLSTLMPKAGGTFAGAVAFANCTWNTVGDDVYIGDCNVSDCLCIKGKYGAGSGIALMSMDEANYVRVLTDVNGTDMCLASNGAVYVSNGTNTSRAPIYASAFNQSSSARVKENVVEVSEEDALKILDVRAVNYDYIGTDAPKDCVGAIAEEVAKLLPKCVTGDVDCADDDEEAIKGIGIDYSKFVPYLIKLAQIQDRRIAEQDKLIAELKEAVGA